jgi:hypothetical protein
MERLKDLVTILYRPRETMRRILDRPDRWSLQVVFLAFVCASVNEIDARRLTEVFPSIHILTAITTVGLAIVAGALLWIAALFILTWIATPIGHLMGGEGTVRDVRAALAWATVPIIWSPIYRLPLVLLGIGANIGPDVNLRKVFVDFASRGGCSIIVLYLGFQLLFGVWCLVLASFTLGEAQRFSTQKGFLNAAITIALPVLVIAAAVFTMRR